MKKLSVQFSYLGALVFLLSISSCSKVHLIGSGDDDVSSNAGSHANLSINSGGGISKGNGIMMQVSIGEAPGLGIPNPTGPGLRLRGGLQGAVNSQ